MDGMTAEHWREIEGLQFHEVRARQPNNGDVLAALARVERRVNLWDDAVRHFQAALTLDPSSSGFAFELGDTYFSVRDFAAAERALDKAIELAPTAPLPYVYKANLYVVWRGDIRAGGRVLHDALTRIEPGRLAVFILSTERTSASVATTDSTMARIIDGLELAGFPGDPVRYHLLKIELYTLRNDHERARLLGEPDQAIELLEPLLKIPSWVSMPALRADPVWRPIWGHPRFRTLLAREQ